MQANEKLTLQHLEMPMAHIVARARRGKGEGTSEVDKRNERLRSVLGPWPPLADSSLYSHTAGAENLIHLV